MKYRVDNIPWLFRPLYVAGACAIGAALYAYSAFCRLTSLISIEGLAILTSLGMPSP